MDIPIELKQRFVEDCCVPIDIFTEPIFGSRIELYDRFYNTIERYNVFLKMIQERYTTYEMVSTATIKAYRKGTCFITAHSKSNPEVRKTIKVVITDDEDVDKLKEISLNATEIYLATGSSRILTATLDPESISDHIILWTSSDKGIATVSGGMVTAVAKPKSDDQTCTITAMSDKDRSKTATCTVHVTDPVPLSDVSFAYHMTHVAVGGKVQLQVDAVPATATSPLLDWNVTQGADVISIDGAGVVTGLKEGSAMVTVSSQDNPHLKDTCSVLVDYRVRPSKIEVDFKNQDRDTRIMVGGVTKFNVNVLPDKTTDKTVYWESKNPNVATVDRNTGLITAVGKGTATIVVRAVADNLIHTDFEIYVVAPERVRDLQIDAERKDMKINEGADVAATLAVGYGIDPTVTWFVEPGGEMLATVEGSSEEPQLKAAHIHVQDYYNDYSAVEERIVQYVKANSAYQGFNRKDAETEWPVTRKCTRTSILSPEFDGHTMISISIDQPWFTALNYYNSTIFGNFNAWEDVVSTIGQTDNDHLIYSENLLKDVMTCLGLSRIESYGRFILNTFYNDKVEQMVTDLGTTDPEEDESGAVYPLAELVCMSVNEIVIDVSRLVDIKNLGTESAPKFSNRLMQFFHNMSTAAATYSCPHSHDRKNQQKPFPLKARLFTLYKLKAEYEEDGEKILADDVSGYIRNIYYEGNQPLEFIDVDPCQLPMLMRTMSYQAIQDNDRKFLHKGLIAQFTDDRKLYAVPISSIPDDPNSDPVPASQDDEDKKDDKD